MRPRLTITLALLLSALLILALPRSGTAAASPSAGMHGQGTGGACSLAGLVPARGSHCPDTVRLRRQAWGLPSIANPVHAITRVVGGGVSSAIKSVALAAILGWVASGAESALKETAKVIDDTTSPQLTSSWFSASYWRVAGIAALLTVPLLCAAAIHAVVRSDLGLLARAAFGYLPLSLLAVGIASQLTMLLLAATDEMSSIVASASLHADGVFLSTTSVRAVAQSVATGDPFVTFLAATITVAATLTLWLELLIRNAAVYVIVLMLPLFFAGMVWPARRTLAIRAIETLIALILSKFAIVAVLALGGSALGHSTAPGAASVLTGGTLVLLAAFTPWALLRMLPLHEVASAAAGGLSHAPKETFSTATDRAIDLAGSAVALGADRADRQALPAVGSSVLARGPRTARATADDGASELNVAAGGVEPIDADLAAPVATAMSAGSGAGRQTGSEVGADPGPPASGGSESEPAVGETSADSGGSATGATAAGSGGGPRWPEILAYPGAAEGGDPVLPLGDDLLALAGGRPGPAAGDADGEEPTAPTDADEPPPPRVAPPPELGVDPLADGDA